MDLAKLSNNSTGDTPSENPPGESLWFCLSLPIGMILMLTSSITILINTNTERLREKPSTKLVNNLAVSDGLAGLAISVMSVLALSQISWMRQPLIKKITRLFPRCLHIVSSLSICSLTLDRYLAICWPLHYSSWVTDARCRLMVALCWLLPLVLLEPFYNNPRIYGINYALLFILASTCVFVLYILISLEFRKVDEHHLPTSTQEMVADNRRIEKRTSRDVLIVFVVNIAFSVPDAVVRVILLARAKADGWENYIWVTVLIILSQLLFLPLYAWKNADFRRALCAFCASSSGRSGGRGLVTSRSLRTDDPRNNPALATSYSKISNQSQKSVAYVITSDKKRQAITPENYFLDEDPKPEDPVSELPISVRGDSHRNTP